MRVWTLFVGVIAIGIGLGGCQKTPPSPSGKVSQLIQQGPTPLRENLKLLGEIYREVVANFSKPGELEKQLEPLSILTTLTEREREEVEKYLDQKCREGIGVACTEKGFLTEEAVDYLRGCKLGEPVGCVIVGYFYTRIGATEKGKSFFRKGCQLGLKEGCRLPSPLPFSHLPEGKVERKGER
ncbi:MAG: hypothetical protein ABGW77_05935 [Campylobacterales bacterium]